MLAVDRWEEVWRFLSLDVVAEFGDDIGLSGDIFEKFREPLREILLTWAGRDEYFDNFGLIHNLVAREFESRVGNQPLHFLSCWVKDFFLKPGVGPERVWWSFLYEVIHRRLETTTLSEKLALAVARLGSRVQTLEDALETRIEEARNRPPSPWDMYIIDAQHDLTLDGEIAKLALIGSSTIFVDAWDATCGHLTDADLQTLHVLAHAASSSNDLPFPGSWRFEIRYFLDRARQGQAKH